MTQATPGRTIGDQIRRGAAPFTAIVTLIVIAALVGGYILSQEGLKLPSWFPLLGKSYYTVNAEFSTAQAITPGQGQAVTIAGVKIGVISGVRLSNGVALVSMNIDKGDAPIYRDATMLLRPKSQLKDMTVEVNKGTPAAGALPNGGTLPVSQTAPDANLDELLASLDADTRSYLQVLIGSAGHGLGGQGLALSAGLRRFDPTTRDFELISRALVSRRVSIARVTHNLALLVAAIGTKDNELANLVRASNAVFGTFAQENANVSATVAKLPGALGQINTSLGKLATTAQLANSALGGLRPTARALGPAALAGQHLFKTTTPVIQNQISPFVRAAQPTLAPLVPAAQSLSSATPNLSTAFGVLNTFFNELAYNTGSSTKPGYLFYLPWANHNINSALSVGDASGALLRGEVVVAPNSLTIDCGTAQVNPSAGVFLNSLNIPCPSGGGLFLSKNLPLAAMRGVNAAVRAAGRDFNSAGGRSGH
jgi:phospholipid/cholesterol/gamma-HCH transport system substrate-binding protein